MILSSCCNADFTVAFSTLHLEGTTFKTLRCPKHHLKNASENEKYIYMPQT